ncbi:phage tail protein, P2 protein I family [Cohaesibacter sp. ES.047]|uniref:phage tail protein I n=1 Tax=Cohaesibacter sp. ES.047 TaxID=1798205 RepID=UPI000BB70BB0|nr:phage tail protein I [Cohaesibacter sp. ES.047]SNY94059.1 phage tail protein, P2 protein I family [Cohaesibacter sp. ES.047]
MTEVPLPPGSGIFEQVLAAAMNDNLPVEYAALLMPYTAPASFLPFLAAQYSVDLWFDDWPEARKREMIAQCAGLSIIHPGEHLAEFKGTFEGLKRYLWFVDAEVIDRVAYPCRFVLGRSSPSFTPLQFPAFKAHYLIRVLLERKPNSFVLGRSALGLAAARPVDLTPLQRAKKAARIAKAEHVEYLVNFSYKRRATFGDALPLDGSYTISPFLDREHL